MAHEERRKDIVSEEKTITFKEWWAAHSEDLPQPLWYVYCLYNADDELIYVGKTGNLRIRMQGHFNDSAWFSEVERVEVEEFLWRGFAEDAELDMIRTLKPKYNQQGTGNGYNKRNAPVPDAGAESDSQYESAAEAARRLGLKDRRVRGLCQTGELDAIKMGRDWFIVRGVTPTSPRGHS